MSRRKRRPAAAADRTESHGERRPTGSRAGAPAARPRATDARPTAPHPSEHRPPRRVAIDLAVLTALFVATVGIAELAGAANLGVAVGIGQVVFASALVALLLRA